MSGLLSSSEVSTLPSSSSLIISVSSSAPSSIPSSLVISSTCSSLPTVLCSSEAVQIEGNAPNGVLNPPPNNNNSGVLCRDYVRNVCYRGSSCKYSHSGSQPGGGGGTNLESLQNSVLFCHDYQNKDYNCPRAHCKFIHATKEEEETFRASGYLPPLAKEEAIRKGMAPDLPAVYGQKPFCKDFLKNSCSRSSCKFRHITPMQYDLEMSQCLGEGQHHATATEEPGNSGGGGKIRRGVSAAGRTFYGAPKFHRAANSINNNHNSQAETLKRINQQLKQQVEDLKKRVSDLSTTNEFLLDQNARLRRVPPVTPVEQRASSGMTLAPCLGASPAVVVPPSVSLPQVPPPSHLVNPSQQTRIDPSVTSINLRPTVSLAPNSALVQETRFLSYPITSILPPMQ